MQLLHQLIQPCLCEGLRSALCLFVLVIAMLDDTRAATGVKPLLLVPHACSQKW